MNTENKTVNKKKNKLFQCLKDIGVKLYKTAVEKWLFYVVYFGLAIGVFLLLRTSQNNPQINISKIIYLITALLLFILMFYLYKARLTSGIPILFNGIGMNILVVLVGFPLLVYGLKAPGIFLINMPLFLVVPYYEYEVKQSGISIKNSYPWTLAIMAIFLLVVALYATGLLEMKSAILISFYSASIAVYTIVFTIVGTFLGFSKSRDENLKKKTKEGKKFNRNNALIGLIRMCIIFILITLIAFLTGMYTADTPVGPDVLSSKLGWTSLGILYPIIMLGLVAVSFPALFTYMYLIINYYLKNQESE